MRHCFPFIRKQKKGNKEVCLAILGIDNAGKTTTTKTIQGETVDLVAPTVGFDKIEFSIEGFNITMYDVGGGKNIRDIWVNYFPEVHGLVYVVDSSDIDRLAEAKNVLSAVVQHEQIREKPILLLANKQDHENALDEGELIAELDLEALVNEAQCPCRLERCSATLGAGGKTKLDKGIKAGLRWILSYVDGNWTDIHSRVTADVAEAAEKAAKEREERRERVRKIREERERERQERGEVDDEDEDGGDPFKRLDKEELEQKSKEEKERKRIEKEKASEERLKPKIVEDSNTEYESESKSQISSTPLSNSLSEPFGFNRKSQALAPLDTGTRISELDDSGCYDDNKKKKKKKRRGLKKNKLEPGGSGEDGEMKRTTSTPDLFVTQKISILEDSDEEPSMSRSLHSSRLTRGLQLGPNADDEDVAF